MVCGIALKDAQNIAGITISHASNASGADCAFPIDSYSSSSVPDSQGLKGRALFSVTSVPAPVSDAGQGVDIGDAARKIESFNAETYNVKWESECEGTPQEVLVSCGRTYMTSSQHGGGTHQITAFDGDGTILFQEPLPKNGPLPYLAASENGRLYFRGQQKTCAIDEKGKVLWEAQSGGLDAIGADGTLYVINGSGWLNAYDHDSGKVKWRKKTKKSETTFQMSAPVAGQKGIYLRAGGELHAFDLQGALKFSIPCDDDRTISPSKDGVIRLFSRGKMETFSPDDGHRIGEYTPGNDFIIHPPPLVGDDGASYLCEDISSVDNRPHVRAVCPDGSLKWQAPLDTMPEGLVMSKDALYVNTREPNGTIYAIDRETGGALWEYSAPGMEELRPEMVLPNGTIIAISYQTHYRNHEPNEIHAISPEGKKRWTFRMDSENLSILGFGADSEILIRGLRGLHETSSVYSLKDEILADFIRKEGTHEGGSAIYIDSDNNEIVIGGVHLPIHQA
jgi:outer membrane protein assembly factor BamB